MMSFVIRQQDIQQMKERIQEGCAGLLQDMERCSLQIAGVVTNMSFTGQLAEAVKSYLQNIHGKLLECSAEIAEEFARQASLYQQGYDAIESRQNFILDQDTMEAFWGAVSLVQDSFYQNHGSIRSLLAGISDPYLLADFPARLEALMQQVTQEAGTLVSGVRGFTQKILELESSFCLQFAGLKQMIDLYENCVRQISGERVSVEDGGLLLPAAVSGSISALRDVQAERFLKEEGVDEAMLSCMAQIGYGAADFRQLLESCAGDADRQMVFSLASGEYAQVFAADPQELSESMNLVLADYAYRLYIREDLQRFESFNNALLAETGCSIRPDEVWNLAKSASYREQYLQRLLEGTTVLLDMNSCAILEGNVSAESKERNWSFLTLAALWNGESRMLQSVKDRADMTRPFYLDITGQNKTTGELQLNLMYYKLPFLGRRKSQIISAKIQVLETSDDLVTADYLISRKKLEQQSENLWKEVLTESAGSALSGLILLLLPEFASAFGILKALSGHISQLDNQLLKEAGKNGTTREKAEKLLLSEAIDGVQAYLERKEELAQAIIKKDKDFEKTFWGSGGLVTFGEEADILSGLYNPEYLETIGSWNRTGIRALVQDPDLTRMGEILQEQYFGMEDYDLVRKMLFGFGEDSLLHYSIDRIARAKTAVETIVRQACPDCENWNVEDAF